MKRHTVYFRTSEWLDAKQDRLWWIGVASIIVFRLWMTASDEILPIRDDSSNYARYALHYLNPKAQLNLPPQPPGLPMVAMVGRWLGIPFKLGLDGIFVLAAGWIALQFRRWMKSHVGSLALFACLVLNPWFLNHTVLFMSEPLTSILVLWMAVAVAPFLMKPVAQWTVRSALLAGALAALYALTRPELILAVGFWIALFLAVFLSHWREFRPVFCWQGHWRVSLLALPLLMPLISVWTVERVHHAMYGVPALSISESPALRGLIGALYTIPPQDEIRFAPVTYGSLTEACDVCPTLNARRDSLLNRGGPYYRTARENLNLEGEFGTWLNWLLVSAFNGGNAESEREMWQAAEEIRNAQRSGKLAYRRAMFPVDPLWRQWLPDLPGRFWEAVSMAVSPSFYYLSSPHYVSGRRVNQLVDAGLFDDALLRRLGTIPESIIRIQGELRGQESTFHDVHVLVKGNRIAETRIESVNGRLLRFSITLRDSSVRSLNHCTLKFVGQGGEAEVILSHYMDARSVAVQVEPSDPSSNGSSVPPEYWTISAGGPTIDLALKQQARRQWVSRWQVLVSGSLIALLCMAIAQPLPRRALVGWRWFAAFAICWFCGRLAFFSLAQVWLQWGLHRYAETNHLLAVFLAAIIACWLGSELRWLANRWALRKLAAS